METALDTNVESSLIVYYSLNFSNYISSLEKIPNEPMGKIKRMENPDKYMLCMNKSLQDIYYSNYREVLNTHPELSDQPIHLTENVVKTLWEKGMDYIDLIACTANDPQFAGFDNDMRWSAAVINVCGSINPLINQPEVATAKSLFNLVPESDPADIYNAFLKHCIMEAPEKKLVDLDKKILSMMRNQGLNEEKIKHCFREGSPLFVIPEIEDDMERFAAIKKINQQFDAYYDQLNNSLAKQENEMNTVTSELPAEHEDEVYITLYSYIESLKDQHENGNLENYWRSSLKEINTALDVALQYQNQVKQALKILRLWADGLERAAREFGLEQNEELPKIRVSINDMIAKADNAKEGWENVFSMLEKVTEVTNYILEKEKNPLLSEITELRNAKPLRLAVDKGKDEDIYFSALKEELAKNPKISLKQADLLVTALLMRKTKLSMLKIAGCVSYSPQFKDLPTTEKVSAAKAIYMNVRQKINNIKERKEQLHVQK